MNKWRTFVLPLALILPVILLGWQWVQARSDAAEGVIWHIPVTGYDPHDMLRGHYVMLSYKWPGLADDAYPQGLCIQGTAPNIRSVTELRYNDNREPETARCDAFAWASPGYSGIDQMRVARYYTDREEAQRIEKALLNGNTGILSARIRPDGVIVPRKIEWLGKVEIRIPPSNPPAPSQ